MAFSLDRIVPWGRSFDEYQRMFTLSAGDLTGRILGCGDGPASFNAEATDRGASVVSVDPLYAHDAATINQRVEDTYEEVLEQLDQNRGAYVWRDFETPEELGRHRLDTMQTFLDDYTGPEATERYVVGELPNLPFEDDSFDLALCSHLLFLYSDRLGASFHVAAAEELIRIAPDVRIFPLLRLDRAVSSHVDRVMRWAREQGHTIERVQVPYEFQRGGNEMLHIQRPGPTSASTAS